MLKLYINAVLFKKGWGCWSPASPQPPPWLPPPLDLVPLLGLHGIWSHYPVHDGSSPGEHLHFLALWPWQTPAEPSELGLLDLPWTPGGVKPFCSRRTPCPSYSTMCVAVQSFMSMCREMANSVTQSTASRSRMPGSNLDPSFLAVWLWQELFSLPVPWFAHL